MISTTEPELIFWHKADEDDKSCVLHRHNHTTCLTAEIWTVFHLSSNEFLGLPTTYAVTGTPLQQQIKKMSEITRVP